MHSIFYEAPKKKKPTRMIFLSLSHTQMYPFKKILFYLLVFSMRSRRSLILLATKSPVLSRLLVCFSGWPAGGRGSKNSPTIYRNGSFPPAINTSGPLNSCAKPDTYIKSCTKILIYFHGVIVLLPIHQIQTYTNKHCDDI